MYKMVVLFHPNKTGNYREQPSRSTTAKREPKTELSSWAEHQKPSTWHNTSLQQGKLTFILVIFLSYPILLLFFFALLSLCAFVTFIYFKSCVSWSQSWCVCVCILFHICVYIYNYTLVTEHLHWHWPVVHNYITRYIMSEQSNYHRRGIVAD